MADINPNDSATLTDGLEIDSYDDVVNLLGAGEAAAMLADAVGNRFNRQDIMKAILNGGDIHLDYWPEYGEYDYAARICGELLADTSLAWADDLIDPDKIKTHKGLTAGDLSHAVTCVLTDRFNDGLDEARLADCKNIADEFARAIESRLGSGRLGRALYVDGDSLRDDLVDKFGFFYDIDFSGLTFKTSLILSVNDLYYEGDVIDAARDWQEDYLPCVCHRGGQGKDDRWEYEPAEDYRPFTRPADIPESLAGHDRRKGRQRPRYAFRAQLPRGYLQYAAESPCRARGPRDAAARRVPGCQPVDDLPRRGRKRRHVHGQARNV